jgi:hypothetical protein
MRLELVRARIPFNEHLQQGDWRKGLTAIDEAYCHKV